MEAVSIAVFNKHGELLVGLRKDTWCWNMPGGYMEEGEKPTQAAVRELREESGISVPQKDLVYLGTSDTGKVKVHCFEVRVEVKRPTTKYDPDKECVSWKWVDVSEGLPKPYCSRWNYDVDCTFEFLGLPYKGEALQKAQTPPTFPGLGVSDNRRDTPIVEHKSAAHRNKLGALAAQAPDAVRHYGSKEAFIRDYTDRIGGATTFHADPKKGTPAYATSRPEEPFSTALGFKHHEDVHRLFGRIEAKHGYKMRHLVSNALQYAPSPQDSWAIDEFLGRQQNSRSGEEPIAYMMNFLNDPAYRKKFQEAAGYNDDEMREITTRVKRGFRAMQDVARTLTPDMVEGFVKERRDLYRKWTPGKKRPEWYDDYRDRISGRSPVAAGYAKSELQKNEGGTKQKKPLSWLGRPVFSEGDIASLERAAAKYEFGLGLPRREAEARAHADYRANYHKKAAAYHVHGMQVARQEGAYQTSAQHASMVQAHMQALGYSPYDAIPPEIEALVEQNETQKIEFLPHEADDLLVYTDKKSTELSKREAVLEALAKASPNVKRNRAAGAASFRKEQGRIRRLIEKQGFRIAEGDEEDSRMGSAFGLGDDQRALQSRLGREYDHELAHALMTPEGYTLREHQENIGPQAVSGRYDSLIDEWASEQLQMMLRRRAGLAPQRSQIPNADTLPDRISWDVDAQEEEDIYDAHARKEYRRLAAERMRDIDEGLLRIDEEGRMVPSNSINAKINRRALGKHERLSIFEALEKAFRNP